MTPELPNPLPGGVRCSAGFGVLSAVQAATARDHWLRPVRWRGLGKALCVEDGRLWLVPTPRGAVRAEMPTVADLCGEWETVDPGEVCEENHVNGLASPNGCKLSDASRPTGDKQSA